MGYSPTGAAGPPIPALFTATCSPPYFLMVSSTNFLLSSGLEVSALTKIASPLFDFISDTTLFPFFSSISETTTFAPSEANRIAIDSPIPDPPPVTIATLLSNVFILISFHLLFANNLFRR